MVMKVQEQHIAVFGEGGSGKTVLVSSFFGAAEDDQNANKFWDLVAGDPGQRDRLYANYLGMKRDAEVPPTTQFAALTYRFSVRLKERGGDSQPFDELCLVWHDYPGEWFKSRPEGEEEQRRREETFGALVRSDVAFLLVDAQKLLDYNGEEERYLKSLFSNFRQEMLEQKGRLQAEGGDRLVEFPRIWIVALSKADLFPEWSVKDFRDLMIRKGHEPIERLRQTIADLVDTPEALSVAEDYMVLSSAKFKLAGAEPVEIDLTERKGLDLILPVASILPLERRVEWASKYDVPLRVLDKLADGAEELAGILVGEQMAVVEKFLSRVSKLGPLTVRPVAALLRKAVEMTGETLRDVHDQAVAKKDYLTATLTQFKSELDRGAEDGLFHKAKQ